MTKLYALPLLSFVVSWLAIYALIRSRWQIVDQPNARSLHKTPVPRTGGVGLMLGVLAAGCFIPALWTWYWLLPLLGLFVVSLMDDVWSLSAGLRLLVHLVLALVFLLGLPLSWWQIPLLLLLLGWLINLYNFMDGSDGLAGGMAVFGFAALAWAAGQAADVMLLSLCLAIVSAALAFLCFNFHPAKIFMGDAGSIPLGFLVASIGIYGWQQHYWPFWFWLLVFSPFVVDATVTLIKRALRGENLATAHRSHYYQRVVQLGWGHRNTALAEYSLMLAVATSACWALTQTLAVQLALLLGWVLVYGILMWSIDRQWRQHSSC